MTRRLQGKDGLAEAGAVLLVLASLLLFHYGTIFANLTPGEVGDSFLVNYTLEDDYRWVLRKPLDWDFWSPAFFFPQPHTAAYTDLMLGVLPLYAAWRLVGLDPQTSFQMWFLTVSALNLLSAYALLRWLLRIGRLGSCAGAILFSFGSPRLMQLGHPQLFPGFYVIAAFAGVCLLFQRRRIYWGLALLAGGTCAQLYTGFYYTWFMIFCGAIAVFYTLLDRRTRTPLFVSLRDHWRASAAALLAALCLVAPFAWVSYGVMTEVGGRTYDEVKVFLPTPIAWLAQGPAHWPYGAVNHMAGIGSNFGRREMFNGIGFVSTILAILGSILRRRHPVFRIWGLVAATVIVVSMAWPDGWSLWQHVYMWFPGARAVRGIGRLGVFLLLPASMGVAACIDKLQARRARVGAIACLLAVVAEQAGSLHGLATYNKITARRPAETIVRQLGPECRTFMASFDRGTMTPEMMHVYGMWAQLLSGIPTLNGYSGQAPPYWPLWDPAIVNFEERPRVLHNIETWMNRHPAEIENVCWVWPGVPAKAVIWRSRK